MKSLVRRIVVVFKHPLFWVLLAMVLLINQPVHVGRRYAAGQPTGLWDVLRLALFAICTMVFWMRYARLRGKKNAGS
jgi:hypothetical protein